VVITDQGGTLVINPDGSYEYTPAAGFLGEDTITLEVCDENGNCEQSELSVSVTDINQNTARSDSPRR